MGYGLQPKSIQLIIEYAFSHVFIRGKERLFPTVWLSDFGMSKLVLGCNFSYRVSRAQDLNCGYLLLGWGAGTRKLNDEPVFILK